MTYLAGRTVLITGGGAGLGRLMALEVARRGALPVVWDLRPGAVDAVQDELAPLTDGRARAYCCDVRDPDAVRAVADRVRADVGDPHIVVNNAGVVSGTHLLDLSDEQIRRTFEVNSLAPFWVTHAFLPAMIEAGKGHVVTIASAAGLVGVARQTDYSASKHAAVGFDESLRAELRSVAPGVRTTVICPFYIDTGMFDGVRSRIPVLLPIMRPADVVRRMVDAVERDRAVLILPPIIRLLPVLRALPPRLFDKVMDLFGVNASMDHFVGHRDGPTGPAGTSGPVDKGRS